MDMCWRWPPVIALIALLGHNTSWFGASSGGAASALSRPAAELGGLLSGADSVVSQIFAWLFVLIAFEVLCCAFGFLVGEIKLRRLYDRPERRWGRSSAPSDPVRIVPTHTMPGQMASGQMPTGPILGQPRTGPVPGQPVRGRMTPGRMGHGPRLDGGSRPPL
jgi:hypothetical protein